MYCPRLDLAEAASGRLCLVAGMSDVPDGAAPRAPRRLQSNIRSCGTFKEGERQLQAALQQVKQEQQDVARMTEQELREQMQAACLQHHDL